jgi:hypothetical protein
MADLFVLALLGHLIGDYLLQSTWMAVTKSAQSLKGVLACTLHVTLYTVAVCVMLGMTRPLIWALIFIPHWVIDHWSLGEVWSQIIGGRTVKKIKGLRGENREFAIAFYAPVYIAVDNTWHFLCLWATIKFFIL